MNTKLYLKNQLPILILQLLCMLILSLFLLAIGNSVDSVCLILFTWLFILSVSMWSAYYKRKKELGRLLDMQEQLKEKYLIAELSSIPERADDQIFYNLLKSAEKSMLEHIEAIKRERIEYKEYIEQ